MSEIEMFLRDFITPAKIKKYAVSVFLFAVFIHIFFGNNTIFRLNDTAGSMIGTGIAFTSAAYVINTYSTAENIGFYLTLPVKKWRMFSAYFFALWISMLIQRISFLIPVIAEFCSHAAENLLLLILNSAAAVLVNIGIFLGKNSKNKSIFICNLVLAAALFLTGGLKVNSGCKAVLAVLIGAGAAASFVKRNVTDLILISEPRKKASRKCISNYFWRVAVTEKIYLSNTACILAFLFVLGAAGRQNPILINLLWCIGAVNTPFLTMISADIKTSRHIDMLPVKKNNIYKQYFIFLMSYFVLINSIILIAKNIAIKEAFIKEAFIKENLIEDVFIAVLLALFETILAVILEQKCRIREWQTKQELWKNPRKYVLPLAVFAAVSICCQISELLALSA